jgi:molybdopterin converting factor small subunit
MEEEKLKITISQLEDLLKNIKKEHASGNGKDYVNVRICTDLDGTKILEFEQPLNYSWNTICYKYN